MTHSDLYDEFIQSAIKEYDAGKIFITIDETNGVVFHATEYSGVENALPRNLILISDVLQNFIDGGGKAKWQLKNDIIGILWTDEFQWQPLSDIGVNKKLGFYSLKQFQNEINDAELKDGE